MPTIFQTPRDLLGKDGLQLTPSAWLAIDQSRIDDFARVTGDFQWIHVDPGRAKAGPFGATIAHGYLTLSLVGMFLPQMIEVRGISSGINVGADRLRFLAPVIVGSRIRGTGVIIGAEEKGSAVQVVVRVAVEIEGHDKPACVVDTISRFLPE